MACGGLGLRYVGEWSRRLGERGLIAHHLDTCLLGYAFRIWRIETWTTEGEAC